MKSALRFGLALLTGLGLVCALKAHVRLRHPSNHNPLYWLNPGEISVVIGDRGSDDLSNAEHTLAMQGAIEAWNRAEGSSARLVEDTSASQRARSDWASDSVHLVLFDEDNSSGYFASGSGIVAISPVYFFASGRIADADILFNGEDFHFTTSGKPGHFDVHDVGAHELGHLLGLNHSGWAGATMYPYVDPSILLHRSPALDDFRGLREAYPSGEQGEIHGRLLRQNESAVRGAHVVLRTVAGRPVAATLSEADGSFRLGGLDGGLYQLYAAPLDGPVSSFNLGAGYVIDLDFGATLLGEHSLVPGAVLELGELEVGQDHALSAGRVADDYPLRVVQGQMRLLRVRGSGLNADCELQSSDPQIQINSTQWLGTSVEFYATVPTDLALGHVDLELRNAQGERAIITAAMEVTPPDPVVLALLPTSAPSHGGTEIVIQGAQFRPGCRVVLGDQAYTEGVAGGVELIDHQTLRLSLAPTIGGLHDVVVIDASGVEGRLSEALLVISQPSIASVFPSAGSSLGGTEVVISGAGFAPGASIWIDGVLQTTAIVKSPEQVVLTTEPGRTGGPYPLVLHNLGGASASSEYSFVETPDPLVMALSPASGSVSGGETVLVHGSGFGPQVEVRFGVHAQTGQGGMTAPEVLFVDESTLRVLTPSLGSGTKSVMVYDPQTDQATILRDAYTYVGSSDSGGACFGSLRPSAPSLRGLLANSAWMLALLVLAIAHMLRRTRQWLPAPESGGV